MRLVALKREDLVMWQDPFRGGLAHFGSSVLEHVSSDTARARVQLSVVMCRRGFCVSENK